MVFPAGGTSSVGVSPTARGFSYAGVSTVRYILGTIPQNSDSTSRCRGVPKGRRGCCGCGSWNASSCGFVVPPVRQPGA